MLKSFFGRKKTGKKQLESFEKANERDVNEDFGNVPEKVVTDPYMQHAWVGIAVELLARNAARAKFEILKNGKEVTDTPAAKLFDQPGGMTSGYDLWYETCSWWSMEGEAFWYFGDGYVCGMPEQLVVMNPRHMQHVVSGGKIVKWYYTGDEKYNPFFILPDEIVHFRKWNPWNVWRGVCPLVSLAMELEQDILAGRQNTGLLKEGGIPKGLLKTDQIISESEADELERRWERKYGNKSKCKVAIIGKGTKYQKLTFSPDELQLFDTKKWNLYTLLAKYGIPPRVANIQDSKSSLSGTDTKEQHAAFWKYTLIPLLQEYERITDVQFFGRLKLSEHGRFNLSAIPELQESEDAQSSRDIAEIEAGLKTINDVLKERGVPGKPWGDMPGTIAQILLQDDTNDGKSEKFYSKYKRLFY
jgi:HK97 family phage portal protein